MSFADYNEIIQRELVPGLIDTVIYQPLEPWKRYFNFPEPEGGDRITTKVRTAWTSNAAAYTKGDVDPASSTQTLVKPYWNKLFYHGSCEVHGIDISNNRPSMDALDMIKDAIAIETADVVDVAISAFYSQIVADVDSSGTAYSDGSLSRSTYATLASYEETTNTAITVAYMRGLINNVRLNKNKKLSDYICLCEEAVYNVFRPLAAALHAWNITKRPGDTGESMGYAQVTDFEGLEIADPNEFFGMTTGSVFMLRKQDVNVVVHRPLEVVATPSGRDSMKFVIRTGMNCYVDHPNLQGKMLDKD